MMRMTVLASGSRGNCTVITGGRTKVLVDAGISCREILKRMHLAGEDCAALDAILITHEHQDHVQGLAVLARKLRIPVYFTEATHRAWMRSMTPQRRMTYANWLAGRQTEAARLAAEAARADLPAWGGEASHFHREAQPAAYAEEAAGTGFVDSANSVCHLKAGAAWESIEAGETDESDEACDARGEDRAAPRAPADPCALPGVEYFKVGKAFSIGDLAVTSFTIPHDATDPVGFVLECEGMRIGLATDLGYMPAHVAQQLRRSDILLLESNHDLDMLRDGPYPWSVKQRVLSRVGHLSNTAAAEFLENGYDGQAAFVVLAHLSESNNMPALARVAAEWALRERMQLLANKLVIAEQHTPTASIYL